MPNAALNADRAIFRTSLLHALKHAGFFAGYRIVKSGKKDIHGLAANLYRGRVEFLEISASHFGGIEKDDSLCISRISLLDCGVLPDYFPVLVIGYR